MALRIYTPVRLCLIWSYLSLIYISAMTLRRSLRRHLTCTSPEMYLHITAMQTTTTLTGLLGTHFGANPLYSTQRLGKEETGNVLKSCIYSCTNCIPHYLRKTSPTSAQSLVRSHRIHHHCLSPTLTYTLAMHSHHAYTTHWLFSKWATLFLQHWYQRFDPGPESGRVQIILNLIGLGSMLLYCCGSQVCVNVSNTWVEGLSISSDHVMHNPMIIFITAEKYRFSESWWRVWIIQQQQRSGSN